jgi:hypothetical protein
MSRHLTRRRAVVSGACGLANGQVTSRRGTTLVLTGRARQTGSTTTPSSGGACTAAFGGGGATNG